MIVVFRSRCSICETEVRSGLVVLRGDNRGCPACDPRNLMPHCLPRGSCVGGLPSQSSRDNFEAIAMRDWLAAEGGTTSSSISTVVSRRASDGRGRCTPPTAARPSSSSTPPSARFWLVSEGALPARSPNKKLFGVLIDPSKKIGDLPPELTGTWQATPQMTWLMPPEAFAGLDEEESDEYFGPGAKSAPRRHDPRYVGRARMPIGDAKPTRTTPNAAPAENEAAIKSWARCDAADLRALFRHRGGGMVRRCADEHVARHRSVHPLGLVRYQENAVNQDLRVSTPVRVWTQLPPRRRRSRTLARGPTRKGGPFSA